MACDLQLHCMQLCTPMGTADVCEHGHWGTSYNGQSEWSIAQGGLWLLVSESVSQGWGHSGPVHSNVTPYIVIPAAWVMHREQLAVPINGIVEALIIHG